MSKDTDGCILTDGFESIEMWKCYFDEHLNDGEIEGVHGQYSERSDSINTAEDSHGWRPSKNNKAADKNDIGVETY